MGRDAAPKDVAHCYFSQGRGGQHSCLSLLRTFAIPQQYILVNRTSFNISATAEDMVRVSYIVINVSSPTWCDLDPRIPIRGDSCHKWPMLIILRFAISLVL